MFYLKECKLRIKATHAKIFNVLPDSVTDSGNTESIIVYLLKNFRLLIILL